MSMSITGGCACGAIRYECSAAPIIALNCHCRDCQRASGSAYASVVAVPAPAFKFLKGEPKYHAVRADNGHTMRRGFCVECGSPLVAKTDESPQTMIIQAASLDDPSGHRPTVDIFTSSAQPWDQMNPALKKIAKEPTEKEVQELLASQG